MKLQKDQRYITIPSQDGSAQDGGAPAAARKKAPDTAAVAYRLEQLVEALGGYSRNGDGQATRPKALLLAQGKEIAKCQRVCEEAGLEMHLVCTRDQEDDPSVRGASNTVSIGERFSEQLFANSYAVLDAAGRVGAKAVMLVDSPLVADERFLDLAWNQGVKVYRPLDASVPKAGWVACQVRKAARETVAWRTCPHCALLFDEKSFATNHYQCPACGEYLRMSSIERIDDVLDAGSFTEWVWDLPTPNPLGFPGYEEKIESNRLNTGLGEAVRCGSGSIAGIRCALCIMDSEFLMGSMGQIVGEKIVRTVEQATAERLPLVVWTASGGARMQEGLMSLMQMAKVSCALAEHDKAGLLYVSVLTDPTTGGVTASFAMQADIVLAEPKALIGFAGKRVIQDTIKRELPEGFQTAEFALEHGLIDAIVERRDLRATIAHILALHRASEASVKASGDEMLGYAVVCERLASRFGTHNTVTYGMIPQIRRIFLSTSQRLKPAQKKPSSWLKRIRPHSGAGGAKHAAQDLLWHEEAGEADGSQLYSQATPGELDTSDSNPAWESVLCARNTKRPTAQSYIASMLDGFIELHGDRSFADDGAIMGGIGWIGAQPVTVIAQEKGADLNERIRRNFGCPMPEGYRKSARLMKQAEKFGRPVVCLVDTQGAYCGLEAEERGQGNAIAESLALMASLETPVVSVLIGEGGSGGALALALADRVAMQQHAVYSILSPEGFASILWKDVSRAPEAAAVMRMCAEDVLQMGIVDTVLEEGGQGAHENPEEAARSVKDYLVRSLDELGGYTAQQLIEARYERFRKF